MAETSRITEKNDLIKSYGVEAKMITVEAGASGPVKALISPLRSAARQNSLHSTTSPVPADGVHRRD